MRYILIAIVAALISGCSFNPVGSDEFSCPGMPKGITCKTPREVYKMTDSEKVKGKGKADVPNYVFASMPKSSTDNLTPMPVLEQAHVMRVWIAPWIDKNSDQHWPGLVFTVIQPKQWHFGNQEFDGVEPPVPHRMLNGAAFTQPAASNKQADAVAGLPNDEDSLK